MSAPRPAVRPAPSARTPTTRWRSPKATSTNAGRFELLATDMKPYRSGPDVDAAWGPVRPPDAHDTGRAPDLRQHLELRDTAGAFRNRVAGVGVDATVWNWSAQFGGLGYDGDLDP